MYLLLVHHWDQASIGFVIMVGTLASVIAQTPVGVLVDRTRAKRALIVLAAVTVTALVLAMPLLRGFVAISVLQALTGIAGSIFAPTLAAITLGIVGPRLFAQRIGRNESFNHAGNASAAALVGGLAYWFGPIAAFWVLAAMAVLSVAATLRIPADGIEHDVARGMDHAPGEPHEQPASFGLLLRNRRLMVFVAAVVTFHFANAAMLPLVGQVLALHNRDVGTALMATCIGAAQVAMVPVAYLAGAKADTWGRKPIFLVAFAVLATRGVLYTLWDNDYWLVGVQVLDGVGSGIFAALFPIVVQDVTHGTGRYNASLGGVIAAMGVGASLSNLFAGWIVVSAGYDVAFISLGAIAGAGLAAVPLCHARNRTESGLWRPARRPEPRRRRRRSFDGVAGSRGRRRGGRENLARSERRSKPANVTHA